MAKADSVLSTPPTNTPEFSPEQALHERLKSAGMQLRRVGNDSYVIVWRNQPVAGEMSLTEMALFVHRALGR